MIFAASINCSFGVILSEGFSAFSASATGPISVCLRPCACAPTLACGLLSCEAGRLRCSVQKPRKPSQGRGNGATIRSIQNFAIALLVRREDAEVLFLPG